MQNRGPRAENGRTQKGSCVSTFLSDGQTLLRNTWLPVFSPAPQYSPEGGGGILGA